MTSLVLPYLDYYNTLDTLMVKHVSMGIKFITDFPDIMQQMYELIPSDQLLELAQTLAEDDELKNQTDFLLKYIVSFTEDYIDDLPTLAQKLGLKYDSSLAADRDYIDMLNKLPH